MTDAADTKAQSSSETGRDYKETLFLPRTEFPMRAGLPKKEPEILAQWQADDIYAKLRKDAAGREPWILHDGPPYANGDIHIGHALNKTIKDVIVRSRQMTGRDASYVPGWDCHGLPIEWKVEEAYRAKGKRKDDVPPAEFRAECRAYAQKWVGVQSEQFERLGIFGDWKDPYTTMAFDAEAAIVEEFLKFARQGSLYRGSKPVMWSPVERTALAEAEVEYRDHTSHTIWVKFPVKHVAVANEVVPGTPKEVHQWTGANVVIWTTTPWTIPGNRAIAYGPSIEYGLYEVEEVEQITDPKTGEVRQPWAQPGDRLIVADELWESVREAARIASFNRVESVQPDVLLCSHPLAEVSGADGYFDFPVPLLPGDHVTDDAGTGFVHTAPSHGQEDYEVWLANGLSRADIPDMVDETGAYYDHVPLFAGEQVVRTEGKKSGQEGGANKAVIAKLIEAGALLARGRLEHSYPHSWRSKAPLIFRNTPQWFVAIDKQIPLPGEDAGAAKTLRERALTAIDQVTWHPAQSINRIRSMVEDRPDWLLSRQRAWGVPLTLFVNKAGDYLPNADFPHNDELSARILKTVADDGADAWFTTPAETFLDGLVDDPSEWEKVEDILDVWFDSGCTHAFVLEKRGLPWPADLYFEGSDQHRGWFQSSLLEACGTRGVAPYKEVLTHGFTMDAQGEKMSKSKGNTVSPLDVMKDYGADILRLWVGGVDYVDDQRLGPETIKNTADLYRKLRNTLRYLLGALADFSEDERLTDDASFPGLERWVRHRMAETDTYVRIAYKAYDFPRAVQALMNFASVDLSAIYFDIRKDALYCDKPSELRRRAARTVMDELFNRLTAWLAPILPFTMEEAWLMRNPDAGSVHLRQFPETPSSWLDPTLAERWARLRRIRRVVLGALEVERREKRIGASLEAAPTVWLSDKADAAALEAEAGDNVEAFLADLCITSQARLGEGAAPTDAFTLEDEPGVAVMPGKAEGKRCARSWKVLAEVGSDARYPDLSPRDAEAVADWDARHGR
ncbi:MAG: isoleucine--tRNA ligase [Maricaulaceae bacterium]|jgi:isoleucyl-tRNA synthetase